MLALTLGPEAEPTGTHILARDGSGGKGRRAPSECGRDSSRRPSSLLTCQLLGWFW